MRYEWQLGEWGWNIYLVYGDGAQRIIIPNLHTKLDMVARYVRHWRAEEGPGRGREIIAMRYW